MNTTRRLEVSTAEFEFSHGRLPRGRGSWAFAFRVGGLWTEFAFFSSTFAATRALALAAARSAGATEVKVGS